MLEKKIVDEAVKIVNMYFNNEDWKAYLISLTGENEVKKELRKVLEEKEDEKDYKN